MDVSKLPKLSETPASPPTEQPAPPTTQPLDYTNQPDRFQAAIPEAFLSFAFGMLLLYFTFAQRIFTWHFHRSAFDWTFNDAQGSPMTYPQTIFYLQDLGVFVFCVLLMLHVAPLLLPHLKFIVRAFLALCLASVVLNLWAIASSGFNMFNALAIVACIYISLQLWLGQRATRRPAQRVA